MSCPRAGSPPTTGRRPGLEPYRLTRCAAGGPRRRPGQESFLQARVGDLYQQEAELLGSERPSGPEVLLIDPWAVMQLECRQMLRRLDALDKPWVQVVVVWNRQDTEMQADAEKLRSALEAALPRTLREGRATSALAVRGVPSLEDFGAVLPTVIAAAGRQYLRYASTHPPTGGGMTRRSPRDGTSDTPGAPDG